MQRITELTSPPTIGETYLVLCLRFAPLHGYANFMPVIADFHDDKEIDFHVEHIHPDYRFFTHEQYQKAIETVIADGESLHSLAYKGEKPLIWQPRQCLRDFPQYPIEVLDAELMQKLERIYSKSKLDCGVCPHKGANLNSIAPDKHGNKVCPLHNLMWSADGSFVPRFGG